MPDQLSQDLPAVETIDILGDDTTEDTSWATDIMPEDATNPLEDLLKEAEAWAEAEVKVEADVEAKEPEVKVEATDKTEDPLDTLLGEAKGMWEEVNDVVDKTAEIKETIEDAKDAIKEDDTNWAEKLIDTLYKQVVEYSTSVDTLSAKNDVLQGKLIELSNKNSDYELEFAQNARNSNDPKMIILNRMYDEAISSPEGTAKDKVVTTLEDMYYSLTGKSFDDTRVDKASDKNAEQVVLNELTAPVIKEEPPEEYDVNDITSIF